MDLHELVIITETRLRHIFVQHYLGSDTVQVNDVIRAEGNVNVLSQYNIMYYHNIIL